MSYIAKRLYIQPIYLFYFFLFVGLSKFKYTCIKLELDQIRAQDDYFSYSYLIYSQRAFCAHFHFIIPRFNYLPNGEDATTIFASIAQPDNKNVRLFGIHGDSSCILV